MSLQILLGFLPWILFSVLFGTSKLETLIAICVAIGACLISEWRHLQKGFILSWGTLVFFLAVLIVALVDPSLVVTHNATLLANLALAAIAFVSLAVNKPFTLQYAKEKTPKQFWQTPSFMHINRVLTSTWGLVFLLSFAIHFITFKSKYTTTIVQQFVTYGAIILGLRLNVRYPAWCRKRKIAKQNKSNRYLQGNFAPIHEENDFRHLPVTGEIPKDLANGVYMRNGPNPAFEPISYTYPFDGDGMIHAIYFEEKDKEKLEPRYRNRYVKTKGLLLEQRLGQAAYGGLKYPIALDPEILGPADDPGPFKNGAFIHVIQHGNKYLAMSESNSAYEIDFDLNTLGEWRPGTTHPIFVGPHTRLDPKTKDLFLINYDITPPYLQYYRINKEGILVENKIVEKPHSTMMHDFVLTEHYLIFFDTPAILDASAAETGGSLLKWQPELGTRIGIQSRLDPHAETIWLNTDAFFVFHFVNAYEDYDQQHIIVDYARHNKFALLNNEDTDKEPPRLYRMLIDLKQQRITEIKLSDYIAEFPTFNPVYSSRAYQFAYAPTILHDADTFNALVKYDLNEETTEVHDFGRDADIGEAVFAPSLHPKAEDDGFVMLFVYSKAEDKSDFVILDAKHLAREPIAKIHLPRRVPQGLHGSWFGTTVTSC